MTEIRRVNATIRFRGYARTFESDYTFYERIGFSFLNERNAVLFSIALLIYILYINNY